MNGPLVVGCHGEECKRALISTLLVCQGEACKQPLVVGCQGEDCKRALRGGLSRGGV